MLRPLLILVGNGVVIDWAKVEMNDGWQQLLRLLTVWFPRPNPHFPLFINLAALKTPGKMNRSIMFLFLRNGASVSYLKKLLVCEFQGRTSFSGRGTYGEARPYNVITTEQLLRFHGLLVSLANPAFVLDCKFKNRC